MPGVSHDLPRLGGSLVGSGLQADVGVPHAADLLLAKVALVLRGDLGAQRWATVLWVQLGLEIQT